MVIFLKILKCYFFKKFSVSTISFKWVVIHKIFSKSEIVNFFVVLETPSLLILSTGHGTGVYLKSTEVVNLGSEMTQLPSYKDNLKFLMYATGGWVGNAFIICGGKVSGEGASKECQKIGKEATVKIGDMMMKRSGASSIVVGESIWILGGSGDSNSETTSEFFFVNDGSSQQGPNLPIELNYFHAATKINSTTSIVIGGDSNGQYSAKTFYYSHQNGQWINGPDLIQARRAHSACSITDSVTQESFIVVTGGYYYSSGWNNLDSVEILDKYGTIWTSGTLL